MNYMDLLEPLKVIICEYIGEYCQTEVECLFGENYKLYEYLYNRYDDDDITCIREKDCNVRYLTSILTNDFRKYKNIIDLSIIHFNEKLEQKIFTDSLHTLTLSNYYNQIIKKNELPSSLVELRFGDDYDLPIGENVLPTTLRILKFGYSYNQLINKNVLPCSLTELEFGYDYNQEIYENVLPKSLKCITICKLYSYKKELTELAKLFSFTIEYYK